MDEFKSEIKNKENIIEHLSSQIEYTKDDNVKERDNEI